MLSEIQKILNRALILPICCFLAIFCQFNTENILASDGNPKIKRDAVPETHLTLEAAINTALRANREILVSGRGVKDRHLALAKSRTDFNLKIFPNASAGVTSYESDTRETIGAGLSFNKKLFSGLKVSVEPKASKSESNYESSVTLFLEKPLLRGSGEAVVLDPVYAAEYSIRSTQRAFYQTRVNTVLKTVSQFYEIARQQEQVRQYEGLVIRLQRHATTAKAKEKVNLATPIDVYRAEIKLKTAEDNLSRSVKALRSAEDGLRTTLAMPFATSFTINAALDYKPIEMKENRAIRIALDNRIEMAQAEDDLAEAKRNAKIAKHNILPELNLVAGYSQFGSDRVADRSFEFDETRWELRLVTSTDFSRSAEKLNYEQSLNYIESVRLQARQLEEDIIREVRFQLRSLHETQGRIAIKHEQIEQAQGKLALAQLKFNYDMANNFDIIEAESELQQARTDLLGATVDHIVGSYDLRAVLGTLIERDRMGS